MVDRFEKKTEIDKADDLFLEEFADGDSDSGTALDEGDVEAGLASPEVEEEESGRSTPGLFAYYVIPAIGALLIMSLGWSFALIARRGLAPSLEELAQIEKGADARVLAKQAPKEETLPLFEGKNARIDESDEFVMPISHPFFIPLEGGGGRGNAEPIVFLNLSVNLLVSNKAATTEFSAKRAMIREEIFTHYNRLSPKDLATAENRERIRQELIKKINKKMVQGKVTGILFQEFFTR